MVQDEEAPSNMRRTAGRSTTSKINTQDVPEQGACARRQPLLLVEEPGGATNSVETAPGELSPTDRELLALAACPEIPPLVSHGIGLLTVACVGLYLASNLSVAVSMGFLAAGDVPDPAGGPGTAATRRVSVLVPDMFAFALANSVTDMWSAKCYLFAVAILLFSGVWPYVKLFVILKCWYATPRKVVGPDGAGSARARRGHQQFRELFSRFSTKQREQWLEILDASGKVSLVDSFVLVVFAATFRFVWPLRNPETGAELGLGIDILYELPFFFFIAATILSLVLGHVVLFVHRFVLNQHVRQNGLQRRTPLWEMAGHNRGYKNRVAAALVCLLVVHVHGFTLPMVRFHFAGAASVLNQLTGQPNTAAYSLLDLARGLEKSKNTGFIQVVVYLFGFGFPVLFVVGLFLLWVLPLRPSQHYFGFLCCQTLRAWAGLDVFVLSVALAASQCDLFVRFIVHFGSLAPVCQALEKNTGWNCFEVVAEAEWLNVTYLLFFTVVATQALGVTVCNAISKIRSEETRSVVLQHVAPPLADVTESRGADTAS
ncbi:unnamed protein product [Amoebophrya sp. A120]|nr:unnamed protein product [Amoebophrya sp. A120]|eukprot:GSA120T00025886001.1